MEIPAAATEPKDVQNVKKLLVKNAPLLDALAEVPLMKSNIPYHNIGRFLTALYYDRDED